MAKGNWTGFMVLPDPGFLSVWSFLLKGPVHSRLTKNVLTTCILATVVM